jgi:hypothetical protein
VLSINPCQNVLEAEERGGEGANSHHVLRGPSLADRIGDGEEAVMVLALHFDEGGRVQLPPALTSLRTGAFGLTKPLLSFTAFEGKSGLCLAQSLRR